MLLHTRQADVGLHTGAVTREIARTVAAGVTPDRLLGPAQQGDRRPQRVRARVRHPPGRRAQGAHDLRDHGRDDGRAGRQLDRARQALRSPRAGPGAVRAGLRAAGSGAEHRVQAVQGDRGQEEAGHRDGPRGAGHRRAARGDRRLQLEWFDVEASSRRPPHATVGVRGPDGEELVGSFTGDGPVDAIFHAINAATGGRRPAPRVPRRRGHRRPGRARRDLGRRSRSTASPAPARASRPTSSRRAARAYVRALSNAVRRRRGRRSRAGPTSRRRSSCERHRTVPDVSAIAGPGDRRGVPGRGAVRLRGHRGAADLGRRTSPRGRMTMRRVQWRWRRLAGAGAALADLRGEQLRAEALTTKALTDCIRGAVRFCTPVAYVETNWNYADNAARNLGACDPVIRPPGPRLGGCTSRRRHTERAEPADHHPQRRREPRQPDDPGGP